MEIQETPPFSGKEPEPAPETCAPNWTANKYKPFGKVQTEIRKRYGDVRILRVALCGQDADAYFQIVILSGKGTVRRVRVAASN
jgi:hypothetical protein